MNMRDLIPWGRNTSNTPQSYNNTASDPFLSLHREMNRLFDDTFRSFGLNTEGLERSFGWDGGWPKVEISDSAKKAKVTAELPGLDDNDVEILLEDGYLTIRGEKRTEKEDSDRQFSEISYGRFERVIPVGADIDKDKVEAKFKNGRLTITLPKTEQAQSQTKRIALNAK